MGDFRAALAELVATASLLVVIDFRFQCESNDSEVQRALRPPFTAERVHLFLSAAALEFYTTASRKFVREGDGFACDQLSVEAVVQNVEEDDDQTEEHKAESGRIVPRQAGGRQHDGGRGEVRRVPLRGGPRGPMAGRLPRRVIPSAAVSFEINLPSFRPSLC
ncbi:hypothetical protein M3Y99_01291600 [Aphelenchoides fujianensis]|nr:hypothetical protein M3Y99_01291600 [Aphelenchoides fujianensis]